MATLDYNSGNGNVTFFSSNVSYPVWFCDNNTGGIQIATRGATPIANTVQIGNASSVVKIYGPTTLDSIQLGNVSAITRITPTEINLSSSSKSFTLNHEGFQSSGIKMDVKDGILHLRGDQIHSMGAGGFNSEYLTVMVNNVSYKIALHAM